jgi:Flp pilus assembly protein TadG
MHILLLRRTKLFNLTDVPSKQAGQSAVEIALLLPLLLLVLMGIIVVAFNFYALIQVSNAAREGARAGALYRITNAASGLNLTQTVQKAVYDPGPPINSALGGLSVSGGSFNVNSDVQVTGLNGCDISSPDLGCTFSVRVTYRYTTPVVSKMLPMFPQPLVIVRSVVMEVQ